MCRHVHNVAVYPSTPAIQSVRGLYCQHAGMPHVKVVAAEGSRTDGQCQQCYCRVLLLALPAETSGRTLPGISIIQALRATGGAVTGQVPVKDAKGLCPASVQIFWHNVTSPPPWIYIQMRRSAEAKHRRQGSGYSEGATAINAARREVASTVRLQYSIKMRVFDQACESSYAAGQ